MHVGHVVDRRRLAEVEVLVAWHLGVGVGQQVAKLRRRCLVLRLLRLHVPANQTSAI